MPAGVRHWPTEVLDSWLWELEAQHFRIAFAIVELAADEAYTVRRGFWGEVSVPVGGLLITLDGLAERARVSRSVVRTALAKLAGAGLVTVETSPRGWTMVTLREPAMFGIGAAQPSHSPTNRQDTGIMESEHPESHSESHSNRTAGSTAIAQPAAQQSHSRQHSNRTADVATMTPAMAQAAAAVAASSTEPEVVFDINAGGLHVTVEDTQHSESQGFGGDGNQKAGPERALTRASEIPDPDPEIPEERESEGEESAALTRRADKIPPEAWHAADFLRAHLLAEQPTNALANKRWERPGSDTAALRARAIGGGDSARQAMHELDAVGLRNGTRLAWADEMRKIHQIDRRPWKDIGQTVAWLFRGQTGEATFVVQSPAALREKWDRIQLARAGRGKPAPATGPVRREPERW